MTTFRWLLCLLGFHDWDGHTDPNYPAPKCRRCDKWHWRKKGEHWGGKNENR